MCALRCPYGRAAAATPNASRTTATWVSVVASSYYQHMVGVDATG